MKGGLRGVLVGLLCFSMLLSLAVAVFMIPAATASPSWWDSNWANRRSISVSPHPENFQIKIVLPSDIPKSDYPSIRFLENENSGLLPYWIENDEGSYLNVAWVRRLENSDNTIWMYYGNLSASSAENGDNVFIFFDDFGGNQLDSNKWDKSGTGVDVFDYALRLEDWGDSEGRIEHGPGQNIQALNERRIIEFRIKNTSTWRGGVNLEGSGWGMKEMWELFKDDGNYKLFSDGSWGSVALEGDKWYLGRLTMYGTDKNKIERVLCYGEDNANYRQQVESLGDFNGDWAPEKGGWYFDKYKPRVWDGGGNSTYYYDWFIVRRYAETEPTTEVEPAFIKECMPDLGQHCQNWCWVGAAANSIYWWSQHGYPELIDDPADPTINDNRYITDPLIPHPPWPGPCPNVGVYRLLHEIAIDCLYPGWPESMITIENTWCTPILDAPYFYGLQEFIDEQGAPLLVHEIVDNNVVWMPPPQMDNIVVYRPPTLEDYQRELGRCQDVLLWLDYRHENYEDYPYHYEDTDHVVTGVGFSYDNTWILVSDPWTTGAPDHGNDLYHAPENEPYENLQVLSEENEPLWVLYDGMPVYVPKLIFISPEEEVECGVDVTILPGTLFISEYIEGSSYNKALEIYNGTSGPVDLSGYKLELYSNGSPTVSQSTVLSGTLNSGDVYVICHGSADAAILAVADATNNSVCNWNGDDAVALRKTDDTPVDIIGKIGEDPGSYWGTEPCTTKDHTLVKKSYVGQGDTNGSDDFDPADDYDAYDQDNFDFIGWHGWGGFTYKSGEPCTWLEYEVVVHNTGTVIDDYILSVYDGLWPEENIYLDNYSFDDVPPCENRTTTLHVHIPDDPEIAPYCMEKEIVVIAESELCGAMDNDSAWAHVEAKCSVDVTIEPEHKRGTPDTWLTLVVSVHNTGNLVDNYLVWVEPDGWPMENIYFESDLLLNVDPCETRTTFLYVHIPDNALPCTHKEIVVWAESEFCGATDNDNALVQVVSKYLHNVEPGVYPLEPGDWLGTIWHEIHPIYCPYYLLSSWEDNNLDGMVSPGDQIDLMDESENITWYYIKEVTCTLVLEIEEYSDPDTWWYLEFEDGWDNYCSAWWDPLYTQWNEIRPVFCNRYLLIEWIDSDYNDYLSYCDWVYLVDKATWEPLPFPLHVVEIVSDIILCELPEPWTGTATISLENLYTVNVEKILDLNDGSKLVVKFYTYGDAYENENVIETFTPPWHVEENELAHHPDDIGVEKAELVLTDGAGVEIDTIATFTVTRDILAGRIVEIYLEWPFASADRRNHLYAEIVDIYLQWPFAPTG